jgi:glycosidase
VLFEGNHDMPRLYSALNGDPDLVKMALKRMASGR